MSLDYYLYIEDNLDTKKLLSNIANVKKMNAIDKNSLKDNKTHMVVSIFKIDEESILESIDETFGFQPNIEIFFTHGKDSLILNENSMISILSEIVPIISGEAIMGFTQSDKPFLQKKGKSLIIDEEWGNIISPSTMLSIINMGLPYHINKLPNY